MKVRNRRSGAVASVSDEYGRRLIESGLYTEAKPRIETKTEEPEEAPKPAPKRRGRPPKAKPAES